MSYDLATLKNSIQFYRLSIMAAAAAVDMEADTVVGTEVDMEEEEEEEDTEVIIMIFVYKKMRRGKFISSLCDYLTIFINIEQ